MSETHAWEHDIRRIEAFSDIVIGFSLAQVGAALVVPSHALDLIARPFWLVAFLWTFALVCLLWWNHHRLFRSVYVPTTLSIVLNFLLLATIVLLAFLAELLIRPFASLEDARAALCLYYGALAFNFLLWALLVWRCSTDPRRSGDEALVRNARRGAVVNAVAGSIVLVAVAVQFVAPADPRMIGLLNLSVPFAFIAGALAARALGYRRERLL